MLDELCALRCDGTADNGALTWDDDFGARILDVILEVETKDVVRAVGTCRGSVWAGCPLVVL
jgi:hypothetical protein